MNDPLSRRERQVMDVVYRQEAASVASVREAMDDPPSYSAVRALLNTLVEKGHLVTEEDGRRYVYRPTVPAEEASVPALKRVVGAFFDGSAARAALALLSLDAPMTEEEIATLEQAIARAREQGR